MKTNKFLAEILEQPVALRNTLDHYLEGEGRTGISEVTKLWKEGQVDKIVFTGMGSSYFISNTASIILNRNGIQAQSLNTGELIHYHFPVIKANTLLVCISQSGESYEVVKLLEMLPPGLNCIGICNESDSTLAGKVNLLLLSQAGKEFMTSTKTFTTTAMVAAIFAYVLSAQWEPAEISGMKNLIETVGNLIRDCSRWLPGAMELLGQTNFIQILGRGPSIAAVQQGALMFMEGARRPASAMFSGEFRHGPMELVTRDFLTVILAPEGETYLQHVKLAGDIRRFGGQVIFISNRDPGPLPDGSLFIPVPCEDESIFSIPAIIPLQFMVNEWAIACGHIPGEFTRGAKVTRTE